VQIALHHDRHVSDEQTFSKLRTQMRFAVWGKETPKNIVYRDQMAIGRVTRQDPNLLRLTGDAL